MNILMLTGSPRKQGTTSTLAGEFAAAASAKGHNVTRLDAAFLEIAPCLGCDYCRRAGECVKQDGMARVWPELAAADAVVFVSPVYYFAMCGQLKMAIDRFYAINENIKGCKKTALISACADDVPEAMEGIVRSYELTAAYLNWQDAGRVLAVGCSVPKDLEGTPFPAMARELAEKL